MRGRTTAERKKIVTPPVAASLLASAASDLDVLPAATITPIPVAPQAASAAVVEVQAAQEQSRPGQAMFPEETPRHHFGRISVHAPQAKRTIRPPGDPCAQEEDVTPLVDDVLRSGGEPLDRSTRAFMEPRFGHDFSHVRVHTDARASDSAESVRARAYAVGSDIVFRAGEYSPETTQGKRLLAHELAHTLQPQSPPLQRAVAPGKQEAMLEEAIRIVQAALDAISLPKPDVVGEDDDRFAGTQSPERSEGLQTALRNLLALRGSGSEEEIVRAAGPILAAAKGQSTQTRMPEETRQTSHDGQVPLLQRQATLALGAPLLAGGPPGWAAYAALAIVSIAATGIIIHQASQSRSRTRTAERAETTPTTAGPSRPPRDLCQKAIKLLTQYERLARKYGSNIPPNRLAELNRSRDAGTITMNHLPGTLQREFPGQFANMTLDAIRALCRM